MYVLNYGTHMAFIDNKNSRKRNCYIVVSHNIFSIAFLSFTRKKMILFIIITYYYYFALDIT